MILVTGASGNVGSAAVQALLRNGEKVRALYRSKDDAANAPAGAQPVIADFADKASLRPALQGVDKVFLVCGGVPQLVELESNMLDACREAGVRHLVLNSALGAGDTKGSFPSWHFQVEQKLRASGVPFTILRPETFMQNLAAFFGGTIQSQGAFYAAMKQAPVAFIHVDDIAAVATKVLTSDGHVGKTYTLTGGEMLSYGQVAERLSKLLGKKVSYVDLAPEDLKKSLLGVGMPQWLADALVELQSFYTAGPGARVTPDVQTVLGRAPITLDRYLQDNLASFRATSG